MKVIQKFYDKAPVWVQNIGVSLYGYGWKQRRFGGIFDAELKAFKERESYTSVQWNAYQTIQLRKLLIHAFDTVSHYHHIFQQHGITREALEKFELKDLAKLPYLDKDLLRQWGTTELLSKTPERNGAFFSSSGSTGTPTKILFSHPMHQRWNAAYEARVRHWAGVSRFEPRGMIGGRRVVSTGDAQPPFYRYNIIEQQVYFSAYHISAATAANYLKGIQQYGISYMVGYAMSNFFLARFIKEQGLEAPNLKAVLTSSEKLTPEMRKVFGEVYDCKTYDAWSGVEACGLISESEYGQLLLSPDTAIIEILKENGEAAKPGEIGELVCTGLLNYDQPLIRYRIGDLVKLSANQATYCGRAMPVIEEIIGRIEDTIIGPDGREIVRFHGIFVDLPNIKKGQIIQHDYQDFEVVVEANKGLSKEEHTIISRRIQSQLGNINLTINTVDSIPLGANGKFKAVISKCKRS